MANHLARPVDFVSEIENLYATGVRTFVEIGPKSVLTGLISAILQNRNAKAWALDASAGKRYGIADLARLLGRLASLGYPVALTQWEKTDATVRKSRMNVLLSGTNYRNQKTRLRPTASTRQAESSEQTLATDHHQRSKPSQPTKPTNEHNNNMSKDNSKQPAFILDALKVVQQGLKSMQHLQSQTAAAHQKFLEAQTEANRSLQAMMQNTQRLAEQSLGLVPEPVRPGFSQPPHEERQQELPTPENIGAAANADGFAEGIVPAVTDNSPFMPSGSAGENPPETAANGYAPAPEIRDANPGQLQPHHPVRQSIEATILEVVSQLTGYPTEMLGLDMDIEAELGIDSIKRVEILSTLEEKMPDLPTVSPEIMGSLKTLGQIVEYLAETDNGNGVADNSSHAAASADNGAASIEPPAHADRAPDVEATMLEVVSQLTGYPIEMLGLDMDIEAELGIDSIKRVEILSTLEEKMPDLPTVSPEIMGSLKTLGQIVEYLAQSRNPEVHPETIDETPITTPSSKADNELEIPYSRKQSKPDGDAAPIPRNVVSIVDAPGPTASRLSLTENRKVFVTEDNTGLSEQIAEELTRQGISTVRVSLDILKYKKQLPAAAGLIIVQDPESDAVDKDLKNAFALARYLAPSLIESADQNGAIFATVTRLDGAFGLKGRPLTQPNQGGLAGLAKTAAIEWQNVFCRAIDIAPDWSDQCQVAKAIVTEVLSPGPIEIGLDSNQRYTVTMQPEPCPAGHINLVPGDVVVISGGARGITAAAALALAKETALTLVLLGRSPKPVAEPGWLSTLSDEAAIKKAILENEFNGQKVTPAEVENVFKSHMANREIAANLAELESTGAKAYYYETDIRDFTMVQTVMADIRKTHGPIAGIIHGAGVLEDRLIIDKTLDQFERVFDTKVKGLENLLVNTGQDQLKYLVLFSSVAARMGNRGRPTTPWPTRF